MQGNILILLIFAGFLGAGSQWSPVRADENRWTHFGLRPLGMGNAYVGVADDFNALFYNPAGLARLPTWDLEIVNPTITTNTSAINLVKDSSSTKDKSALLSKFTDELGQSEFFAISFTPHLVGSHYGLGVGMHNAATLVMHGDVSADVDVGTQIIAPVGLGFNFLDKRLSIGVAPKMVAKIGVDERLDLDTLTSFVGSETKADGDSSDEKLKNLVGSGWGLGLDTGLLFTPQAQMEPTMGISITDLGDTKYQHLSGLPFNNTPRHRPTTINTGLSLKPWVSSGKGMYLLVAADTHMINRPIHYSHKLNLGAELGLSKAIKFQVGLKEGYPTAGVQFDFWLLIIRFATWAVDHGEVVGLNDNMVERRVALQVNLFI